MKQRIEHDLSRELARKATRRAYASYKERFAKYEPQASWKDEDNADISFTAKGVTLNGSIELKDGAIELDLDVPFFLKPFRKQALGVVEKEIQTWIEKARNGELDDS